jgi:hypothetical protein
MNKLARNTLALGTATMIVTAGLSFSANGAEPVVARSSASAITATGLTGIVNSAECRAESTGPATAGTGTCGVGLGVSQPAVTSFTQTASTDRNGRKGTSTATAEVAGTGINALTTIDLRTLQSDVGTIDTGTALDDLIGTLDPVVIQPAFEAILTPLLTAVQDNAVTPLLTALQANLPVSVRIGAVASTCEATSGSAAGGNATVAGIDILVDFPGANDLVVPVALNTSANSQVVGAIAPQQIVDRLLIGVEDTLTASLDETIGDVLLDDLAGLVTQVRTALLDPILDQLGPALLDPVGEAISPVLNGTVNKQTPAADGSLEVTALDLNLLGTAATLDLARTSCGPNSEVAVVTPTSPEPTAPGGNSSDSDADSGSDADNDADGSSGAGSDSDAVADADAQADADVTTTLPAAGAPNLLPFWLLGIALLLFGGAVLVNERRRLNATV